jgi:uncharacterized protein YgbK (DUF1537 family)
VLVLADDATGALEMGALLAPCPVWLGIAAGSGVIDTESRHLAPADAADRIRSVLRDVPSPTRVFKKIDSTLRGPIAAELAALAGAFPDRKLIVCPAYPRFGRTVRNGRVLIHGTSVSETDFARDPRWPVTDSAVPWTPVYDAETDEDLAAVARLCASEDCICVGSGGLARCLFGEAVQAAVPNIANWLVVCGSMHPVSLRQAEVARAHGVSVVSGPRAAEHAVEQRAGGLIIFGGETTFETLRALGLESVTTVGEVLPGVPLSLAGEMPVITKAGGFGSEDLVPAILRKA